MWVLQIQSQDLMVVQEELYQLNHCLSSWKHFKDTASNLLLKHTQNLNRHLGEQSQELYCQFLLPDCAFPLSNARWDNLEGCPGHRRSLKYQIPWRLCGLRIEEMVVVVGGRAGVGWGWGRILNIYTPKNNQIKIQEQNNGNTIVISKQPPYAKL